MPSSSSRSHPTTHRSAASTHGTRSDTTAAIDRINAFTPHHSEHSRSDASRRSASSSTTSKASVPSVSADYPTNNKNYISSPSSAGSTSTDVPPPPPPPAALTASDAAATSNAGAQFYTPAVAGEDDVEDEALALEMGPLSAVSPGGGAGMSMAETVGAVGQNREAMYRARLEMFPPPAVEEKLWVH